MTAIKIKEKCRKEYLYHFYGVYDQSISNVFVLPHWYLSCSFPGYYIHSSPSLSMVSSQSYTNIHSIDKCLKVSLHNSLLFSHTHSRTQTEHWNWKFWALCLSEMILYPSRFCWSSQSHLLSYLSLLLRSLLYLLLWPIHSLSTSK